MFLEIVILRIQDSEVIGMIFKECRKRTKWKCSSASSSSSNGQMPGWEHQWWRFTSEASPTGRILDAHQGQPKIKFNA